MTPEPRTREAEVDNAAANTETEVVTVVETWTLADLAEAFDVVKNAEHWKNPIDADLPEAWSTEERRKQIRAAVIWYTGSVPAFHRVPGKPWRCVAAGYYLTI
jgi:hypothetical protein